MVDPEAPRFVVEDPAERKGGGQIRDCGQRNRPDRGRSGEHEDRDHRSHEPARCHLSAGEEPLGQRGIVGEVRDLPPAEVHDQGRDHGDRGRDQHASESGNAKMFKAAQGVCRPWTHGGRP